MTEFNTFLRLTCAMFGHVPKDVDLTGGDLWMGGPLYITVCYRCYEELPMSDTAKAFDEQVDVNREHLEDAERSRHYLLYRAWWQRPRCACGWSKKTSTLSYSLHIEQAVFDAEWS